MQPKIDYTAYHFDTALLPVIWTICGVQLKPFSLGHFIILRQLKSPMINEVAEDVSLEDGLYWFFNALLVCALSYEDNLELLANEARFKEVYQQFCDNLIKNIEAEKNWNIFSKLHMFKEYMSYYMEMPVFDEEGKPSEKAPSGIDWTQNIFVTFKKLGYSETEILNMNFRKLFYEWTSHAESEGAIRVWNKVNLDQLARARGLL
jgi:hypothetical protein